MLVDIDAAPPLSSQPYWTWTCAGGRVEIYDDSKENITGYITLPTMPCITRWISHGPRYICCCAGIFQQEPRKIPYEKGSSCIQHLLSDKWIWRTAKPNLWRRGVPDRRRMSIPGVEWVRWWPPPGTGRGRPLAATILGAGTPPLNEREYS